jgi:hypothetical protein
VRNSKEKKRERERKRKSKKKRENVAMSSDKIKAPTNKSPTPNTVSPMTHIFRVQHERSSRLAFRAESRDDFFVGLILGKWAKEITALDDEWMRKE